VIGEGSNPPDPTPDADPPNRDVGVHPIE
jgi:hypothetical protein